VSEQITSMRILEYGPSSYTRKMCGLSPPVVFHPSGITSLVAVRGFGDDVWPFTMDSRLDDLWMVHGCTDTNRCIYS